MESKNNELFKFAKDITPVMNMIAIDGDNADLLRDALEKYIEFSQLLLTRIIELEDYINTNKI